MSRAAVILQKEIYLCALNANCRGILDALDQGADVNGTWCDASGTPLAGAVASGIYYPAKVLLDYGADPTGYESGLLFLAALPSHYDDPTRYDLATEMLQSGADPNWKISDGRTALLAAAGHGNPRMIKLLLKHGADPHVFDLRGDSALHTAARHAHSNICELLAAAGADIDGRRREDRWTPLHLAADDVWIFPQDSSNDEPRSQERIVLTLLRLGANVSARSDDGCTPLHLAAMCKRAEASVVLGLVRSGSDIEARDDFDNTPLHLAAITQSVIAAGALLELGADVTKVSKNGFTPLLAAVAWGSVSKPPGVPLVRALIDAGSSLNAADIEGSTALHLACYHGSTEVAHLLAAAGGDIKLLDNQGRTPGDVARERGHLSVASSLSK